MRIVSVTLADNQEKKIKTGLSSVVEHVDACIVMDTGITDKTLDIAREVCGDKLIVESFTWTGSFADARNAALEAAMRHKADWMVFVDTDEAYEWRGMSLRGYLESLGTGTRAPVAVLMRDRAEGHSQVRILRLPTVRRFTGVIHETFPIDERCPEMPVARSFEFPKTDAENEKKFRRDLEHFEKETKESPSSRAWFYLGLTRWALKMYALAEIALEIAFTTSSDEEEAAWSAYIAAQCARMLGKPQDALLWCAKGLTRHGEAPELPWCAAEVSLEQKNYLQAVRWARMALSMAQQEPLRPRRGLSNPSAKYEGPYDVLIKAYKALGMTSQLAEATEKQRERLYASLGMAPPPHLNEQHT